ncbi:MAG: hypothetical protein Q7U34_06630, partial [Anaerolineales bacterium]|nr:hypothetical protein [Anaerolineales bacterium]
MFWLVTLLFGLGLFVLFFLLLSVAADGIGGLLARRKRQGLARLVSRSQQTESRYAQHLLGRATREDLLGLERI